MKLVMAIAYVMMIVVNALANILPINGFTTGEVSDLYPNLFAPAGITFSIWGLIYLLLGVYVVSQFLGKNSQDTEATRKVNLYFTISSIINSFWILAWHYRWIGLTVVLMLALLYCLIKIADLSHDMSLNVSEKLLIKIPFGVYFGWITVATIANITAFLVSIGWKDFIFPDYIWMIIVLFVWVGISIWRTWKDKNLAYGLVPVWAYLGIYLKHTSLSGFNGQYPHVITAVIICLIILLASNAYMVFKKRYF